MNSKARERFPNERATAIASMAEADSLQGLDCVAAEASRVARPPRAPRAPLFDVQPFKQNRRNGCGPTDWCPRRPADGKVRATVVVLPEAMRFHGTARLSMTVADLKEAIMADSLVSPAPAGSAAPEDHQLFLATGGEPLDNGSTLADLLHLVVVDLDACFKGFSFCLFPVPDRDGQRVGDATKRLEEFAVPVRFTDNRVCQAEASEDEYTTELVVRLPITATVHGLRARLQEAFGVGPDKMELRLPGTDSFFRPSDDCSLFYLASRPGDWGVKAFGPTDVAVVITVKTCSGKRLLFALYPCSSPAYLKAAIAETEGIPQDQQRLVYRGKRLEDDRTLADYDVVNNSTLHLTVRLT